jgi:hypothetical protein
MIKLEAPEQSPLHRLLGGWRDVYDDIKTLCRTLADVPEGCQCHDASAHLNGRCPCCGTAAVYRVPACGTCDEQLERLRPAIDTLTVDRSRFLPVVREILERRDAKLGDSVKSIDRGAMLLAASFERLLMAVAAFRTDCRLTHVRDLKDAGADLLAEAKTLDDLVEGGRRTRAKPS